MLKPEESSSNDQRMDQHMIGFLESLYLGRKVLDIVTNSITLYEGNNK
jgi:hypothetical protein